MAPVDKNRRSSSFFNIIRIRNGSNAIQILVAVSKNYNIREQIKSGILTLFESRRQLMLERLKGIAVQGLTARHRDGTNHILCPRRSIDLRCVIHAPSFLKFVERAFALIRKNSIDFKAC